MSKAFQFSLLAVLLAAMTISPCLASPPEPAKTAPRSDTAKIVDYLFDLFGIRNRIAAMAKAKTAEEPELEQFASEIFGNLDPADLADQLSKIVSIPRAVVPQCLAFPNSAAGKAALRVAAGVKTDDGLMAGLQSLPPEQSNAVGTYLNSPCTQAVTSAMTSDAGKALFAGYGEFAMCRFVREKHPEKLELMQRHDKCLERSAQ